MLSANGTLAAALVLVVLGCHGVMGPAHQLSDGGPGVNAAVHEAGETSRVAHGSPVGHELGCVEYAAALLALSLLGSVLGLFLRGYRPWRRVSGAGPARSGVPRPVLRPPPAPALPLLQVFRL